MVNPGSCHRDRKRRPRSTACCDKHKHHYLPGFLDHVLLCCTQHWLSLPSPFYRGVLRHSRLKLVCGFFFNPSPQTFSLSVTVPLVSPLSSPHSIGGYCRAKTLFELVTCAAVFCVSCGIYLISYCCLYFGACCILGYTFSVKYF